MKRITWFTLCFLLFLLLFIWKTIEDNSSDMITYFQQYHGEEKYIYGAECLDGNTLECHYFEELAEKNRDAKEKVLLLKQLSLFFVVPIAFLMNAHLVLLLKEQKKLLLGISLFSFVLISTFFLCIAFIHFPLTKLIFLLTQSFFCLTVLTCLFTVYLAKIPRTFMHFFTISTITFFLHFWLFQTYTVM